MSMDPVGGADPLGATAVSGGAVYRFTLGRVMRLELCDEARRDVTAALEAARSDSLLQLLYEAGHEGGHRDEALLARAAGCFCFFAAGNLCDDLVDGDCSCFDAAIPSVRIGPTVQWMLQHAGTALLAEAGLGGAQIGAVSDLLCRAAGPQQLEIRTDAWTAERYVRVGDGIVSGQWHAYLFAMWCGTPLESDAGPIGKAMGFAGHVARDVRTLDRRFHSLSPADKDVVIAKARADVAVLERSARRIAALVVGDVRPALRTASLGAYYDEKTARILARYGPGPRVHYHTGMLGRLSSLGVASCAALSTQELREQMVHAQERLVFDCLEAWRLTGQLAGLQVIDCGCGLGGTSLLLADAGADVTALTVSATHASLVEDLAVRAGASVAARVHTRCGAVEDVTDRDAFDAAVVVEASCYFDRGAFFRRMRDALKPGGRVLIVDLFVADGASTDVKERFDRIWRSDVGTLAEYDAAATAAGFVRTGCDDISEAVAGFWDLTRADSQREVETTRDDAERERLERSIADHAFVEGATRRGELVQLRLSYETPKERHR